MSPDAFANELEEIFGQGTIRPPLSFASGRKKAFFAINLSNYSEGKTKSEIICNLLRGSNLPDCCIIRSNDDFVSDNQNNLYMEIGSIANAQIVLDKIKNLKDQIQNILNSNITKEPTLKGLDKGKWGTPSTLDSCPALATLAYKKWKQHADMILVTGELQPIHDDEYDKIQKWMIPPQNPNVPMFVTTDDGKIGLATPEQTRQLRDEFNNRLRERREILIQQETNGFDHMFDHDAGEITNLPLGTIFNKITAAEPINMTGTYWNPVAGRFYDYYKPKP